MSGGGALNLSLLSRGIGEVQKNGHEKVEVFLEPSDYFNFAADRPYYLPPIQSSYHFAETSPRMSTRSARDGAEIPLPKTFTTRKGALLLFSEDMALKTNEKEKKRTRHHRHHPFHSSLSGHDGLDEDETAIVLKTVDDLAKSILQYGGTRHDYDDQDDKMYLKFIHRRREQWQRQIRPGYSAKRYLSTWTKNWDDQVFETVVSKGYLTERSLFHYNLFLPHLRRHLFHEDLSNMPQPYRLMKNMLLTPGSLSGYTFFRDIDLGPVAEDEEEGADGQRIRRPDTKRSIRVIRTTKEGLQKEISYSALDKDTQKEVITDLLVKSAVHYALSKQEEIIEESLAQAMQSEHEDASETTYELSVSHKTPAEKSVPNFDMRDAVDSLLDTQKGGPYVLGGDLPDVDARSHSSDHTGSFKGSSVPQHAVKAMGSRQTPRGSWPASAESGTARGGGSGGKDKEFLGDLPVAAVKDMSASSSQSSIPQLPPITRHALSPIKDVSRETSQLVTLPPIHRDGREEGRLGDEMPTVQVMPPTPQLSTITAKPSSQSDQLQKVTEDSATTEAGGYQVSSESSPTNSAAALTQRAGQKSRNKGPKVTEDVTKGKGRSLAAGSVESKSMKGSMIMAPDGEIISVGGSVVPPKPADVGVISDVTPHIRPLDVNMTDESGMSDEEPDEWRAGSKMRKPRALSSKLSDSLKRSVGKRESQSSLGSGAKSVVSSEKEEKEEESGRISVVVKKPLVTSKEMDNDSLASASLQIDYTSGDIDATVSIHSWSYAPLGEEGENGLVKTGSVRSLPGLSNEGGHKESLSTAEHTHDEGNPSDEDDERWTRITERPEEEEAPNMSREPTQDEMTVDAKPQGAYLSPHYDPTPASQLSSSHPSVGDQIPAATPEDSHLTPEEKESPSKQTMPRSKHTTPGPPSKLTTPRIPSKHTTPGPSKHPTHGPSKHPTPDPSPRLQVPPPSKHTTPGESLTPGNMLGTEPTPSASEARPTPGSVAQSQDGENTEDDQEVPGTARSRSVALQTDSDTPDDQTPRAHSTSTTRRESGSKSGEEEDQTGEDQWPQERDVLDVVPEESQKGSAVQSRITSSVAEKHATPDPSRSQTAEDSGLPGSRAESRKSESAAGSRQGSSKTVKSRAASSKRGTSRTGSSFADQPHNETSTIREETNVTENRQPSADAEEQEGEQRDATPETYSGEDGEPEDADQLYKEPVSSRSEKSSSKTGPSPQSESKLSHTASKPGSRVPSTQPGRQSIASEVKSSPMSSAKGDIGSRDQAPSQLKPRTSAKESGSRSSSSKASHYSQAKSQAKEAPRSLSTRLSEARMTTPPLVKDGKDPHWEEGGPESSEQDDVEVPLDDYRPASTPSSATVGTAKVSDEEPPRQGMDLSVEGTQLLTPPSSPPYGHRTRMTVQESVVEETADTETVTIASRHSSVTEQDILDTLTEHAKRIADSVLSNNMAGQDLEQDVRNAADMWMTAHPTRDISRSHSVQDGLKPGAVEEIMHAQRRASSAGPSTEEYKDLIRQSLTTAVAKAAGLNPEEIPEDAEISPDLLEALTSQKLTPDDIAIYRDEETGRPVIKSRTEMAQALGGVAEGHIYVAPNGKGSEVGIKRQMSIPADRASLVDNMEYDVISYGGTEVMSERGRPAGRSKAGSKPGSIAGGTVADLKDHPGETAKVSGESSPDAEHDEFKQRLEQLEKEKDDGDGKSASLHGSIKEEEHSQVLPGDDSPKSLQDQDRQSEKSAKTGVSQKTEKSDDSKKKKAKSPEEPFVVGKSDKKGELEKLYGPVEQSPTKKDKGKAETKAMDKSPLLPPEPSPRKSPRKSGKSDPPKQKSPPKSPPPKEKSPPLKKKFSPPKEKPPPPKEKPPQPKEKTPSPKEKSPRQEKVPSPKPNKTPCPEPAGEEAAPPQEKPEKAKRSRQKKEKTAFPRRGSRAMEAELKARQEREKEASIKGSETTEISEEKSEVQPEEKPEEKEVEQKVPEVVPEPVTKPAETLEPDAGAKTTAETTPPQEGVVDHKAELSKLYGTQGPGSLPSAKVETKSPVKSKKPKKDDKKEKGKKKGAKAKKKGKKEEEATPEVAEETPAPPPSAPVEEPKPPEPPKKEPTPLPTPREPDPPKPMTASSSERPFLSSPELTRTDDEMEFTIVREESSPEPEPPQRLNIPPPFPEEEEEEIEEDEETNDAADGNLKSISNREARAAKRAAAAAKRKEEVEKRRREREEQLKREKEEQERQEQLKKEMETERKRREEERRLRKQREAEEALKEEKAQEEAERRKRLAEEKERRAKEDYQRKLEEMRRKQIEEEAKRMELLVQKQKEEEERRAEEELMMSQMAEQERLEYERKKKEEEEERKRLEEEERLRREEEAQKAMEEARRLAEEMARKQAELEARLKFNRALQVEASGMDHSQDINRAFVFSYFELLQWLGLDIPEFELAKMTQL